MRLGGRPLRTIARALTERRHYHALRRAPQVIRNPVAFATRYLTGKGHYPHDVEVRTPTGSHLITLYSHHDLLTVNEIFCREDYYVDESPRVVVDFGSNIGLSALYFLSRNRTSRAFLYEPVPRNAERLHRTLRDYESRFELQSVCIGTSNGTVEFGIEATGRYGGIGIQTGTSVAFPCRNVNDVLRDIFARGISEIDVLKSDMEGIDDDVLRCIAPDHLKRIRLIYCETDGRNLHLPGFKQAQRGSISRWTCNAK